MKKLMALILAALMILAISAGCQPSTTPPDNSQAPVDSQTPADVKPPAQVTSTPAQGEIREGEAP